LDKLRHGFIVNHAAGTVRRGLRACPQGSFGSVVVSATL
jgi:hypothetical protein